MVSLRSCVPVFIIVIGFVCLFVLFVSLDPTHSRAQIDIELMFFLPQLPSSRTTEMCHYAWFCVGLGLSVEHGEATQSTRRMNVTGATMGTII